MEPSSKEKERVEATIYVPWDVLDACNGFAFDIGGSVLKAVYIHKDDWKEPSDRTEERGPLRLVNFSREEIKEAFPYIQERAYIKRKNPEDEPLIYTTGIGGAQFLRDIRDKFNVETKNLSEMDCFIQAHRFMLEHQTQTDLVHTTGEKAIKGIRKHMEIHSKMIDNMKKGKGSQTAMAFSDKSPIKLTQENKPDSEKTFMVEDDIYPNLLLMCGSAGGVMKIEKDGTFLTTEMLYRCGRMFLGLGCMLTGAKTYDELMEMAEKGDATNIHQNWADVTKQIPKEDDSMYSTFTEDIGTDDMDEMFVFMYGKVVGKSRDQVRPEDLAKALVISSANDLAQNTSLAAAAPELQAKHTFFCGNYVAHPLMRHYVTLECGKRDSMQAMMRGKEMRNIHFLKHGAHYGALGALLNHKLKFTEQMAEMSAKAEETFKEELGLKQENKEDLNVV